MIRLLEKKSPFVGDRNHLHHILIDSDLTHFQASAILWLFSLVCTLLFLLISKDVSNMTSLWILCGVFGIYMWISHVLKQRVIKKATLSSQEEKTEIITEK
jgi:hypothetical protein